MEVRIQLQALTAFNLNNEDECAPELVWTCWRGKASLSMPECNPGRLLPFPVTLPTELPELTAMYGTSCYVRTRAWRQASTVLTVGTVYEVQLAESEADAVSLESSHRNSHIFIIKLCTRWVRFMQDILSVRQIAMQTFLKRYGTWRLFNYAKVYSHCMAYFQNNQRDRCWNSYALERIGNLILFNYVKLVSHYTGSHWTAFFYYRIYHTYGCS
jgi:hypothetical protein